MILFPIPGNPIIRNLKIKKRDDNYHSKSVTLMENIDIDGENGTEIHLDDYVIAQFIDNLEPHHIERVFDKLSNETLQKLADKIYKSKFEDLVNK